jgi:hypothetical protein
MDHATARDPKELTMRSLQSGTPAQFIADFYHSFTEEAVHGAADPAVTVDRYFTPDIVQISDGLRLDRASLIAHLRPVRKNLVSYRFDVHEALATQDRVAARFTIHAQLRKGGAVSTQVHLFARIAADGRMCSAEQLTRDVTLARPPIAEEKEQ